MPKFTSEEVREEADDHELKIANKKVVKMLLQFADILDKIKELDEEYEATAYPRLIHELAQVAGLKE